MSAENSTRACFYVAVGMLIGAAVTLGLAFIPDIGVYMLIASVVEELIALSLLSSQKKKNNFKGVFIVTVIAYVFLAVSIGLFIGGLVYVAVNGGH